MRQFVPLTDEMLYQMGGLPGPLVPYRAGLACRHALVAETAKPASVQIVEAAVEEPKSTRTAAVTAPAPYTSSASACP